MTKRLKQIWSGFEETTSRELTGRGIDNIDVPHRTDYAAEDRAFLSEDFHGPAETAFAALRERLGKHEKKFRTQDSAPSSDEAFGAAPPAFAGDDLTQGLRATALRTERAEYDYAGFLSSDEGRSFFKKHKKKKRFGFF